MLPHKKINPKPTDCPGDRFPYSWLRLKVRFVIYTSDKVGITGVTGFIGSHVACNVAAMVTNHGLFEGVRERVRDPSSRRSSRSSGLDAIVNLAGEPILGLWTEEKKRRIRESRILAPGESSKPSGDGRSPAGARQRFRDRHITVTPGRHWLMNRRRLETDFSRTSAKNGRARQSCGILRRARGLRAHRLCPRTGGALKLCGPSSN